MRYRFLEALDKIVGTERRINRTDSLGNVKFWVSYDGKILKDNVNCEVIWPSLEDQKAKIWEVEPGAIYVWGVCDDDGHNGLYGKMPKRSACDCEWEEGAGEGIITLFGKNLFSKTAPQKFKLVPVEEAI